MVTKRTRTRALIILLEVLFIKDTNIAAHVGSMEMKEGNRADQDAQRRFVFVEACPLLSLCAAFAGDRRAGRERPERCDSRRGTRHPRRGIKAVESMLLLRLPVPATFDIADQLEQNMSRHSQMRSPAELRQQSEELYAVIDDVLASSTPTVSSGKCDQMSKI